MTDRSPSPRREWDAGDPRPGDEPDRNVPDPPSSLGAPAEPGPDRTASAPLASDDPLAAPELGQGGPHTGVGPGRAGPSPAAQARPGGRLNWHDPELPEEEPSGGPGYSDPTDPLEREAAGLPPLDSGPRSTVPPPREITVSLALWLAAAAATALAFVLMIVDVDDIAEANVAAYNRAVEAGDPIMRTDITADDVRAGASGLVWLLGSGGVMLAMLVVTFAYRMREGTRSARTVLVALALVVVAFCGFMPAEYVNPAHWAGLVLGGVAAVLLFLPAANAYLPKIQAPKRRWRGDR